MSCQYEYSSILHLLACQTTFNSSVINVLLYIFELHKFKCGKLNYESKFKMLFLHNRDSLVDTEVLTQAVRRQGNCVSISSREKRLFSSPKRPDRLWGPTTSYLMDQPVLFRVQEGRGVILTTDLHLGPKLSISETTIQFLQCLHGAHRDHYEVMSSGM